MCRRVTEPKDGPTRRQQHLGPCLRHRKGEELDGVFTRSFKRVDVVDYDQSRKLAQQLDRALSLRLQWQGRFLLPTIEHQQTAESCIQVREIRIRYRHDVAVLKAPCLCAHPDDDLIRL